MIVFKILAPLVVLAISLIKDVLSKKANSYRHSRSILIGLMVAAAFLAVATILLDYQRSIEEMELRMIRETALQRSNDSLALRADSLLTITKASQSRSDMQNAILQARVG